MWIPKPEPTIEADVAQRFFDPLVTAPDPVDQQRLGQNRIDGLARVQRSTVLAGKYCQAIVW